MVLFRCPRCGETEGKDNAVTARINVLCRELGV